jgi:hypothetical protein
VRLSRIDSSVFCQNSENDSIRAELLRRPYILLHGLEFIGGVAEIAATGTNHDKDAQRNLAQHSRDNSRTGSETSLEQAAAKLNPVRSAAIDRNGRLDRIHADFKDYAIPHMDVRPVAHAIVTDGFIPVKGEWR